MNLNIKKKILIHCQYVYGIGHFVRTLELAKGLIDYFDVLIINGGENIPNFDIPKNIKIIQLPAIYKKEDSLTLSTVDPTISLENCFKKRDEIIKNTIKENKPNIVITEHFPFGLLFKEEVLNLISFAKNYNPICKIICSVREIIESNKINKSHTLNIEILNKLYDLILVHGDENHIHLRQSFSQIDDITVPIYHTGYIVRKFKQETTLDLKHPMILTSIAGGRLGSELLDSVINCHLSIKEIIHHKLILFSGAFQNDFNKQKNKIAKLNSNEIELYSFDSILYQKFLSKSNLVISLGGYNSIVESLSIQKNMLVYQRNFSQGNEEQDIRIKHFEKTGHLKILNNKDLEKPTLTKKIIDSLKNNKSPLFKINMNGVQRSIEQILELTKNTYD
jgi:predicted glycosyltransferase